MEDENKVLEDAVKELKESDEENLKETISKWFEKTRNEGMSIGAKYISFGIYAAIKKHTNKPGKVTLRDYERCIKDIMNILEVQLKIETTEQNDSEEKTDDGTAAESSESNS